MLIRGDLFDALPTLEAESFDACVTDPPYGIGFMGKEWDTFKPEVAGELRARTVKNHKAATNPNLKGRMQWAGGAAVEYDYSVNALRGFQDWTAKWSTEVRRVLKPGAYLLVCGAPRSFHRMACGLEDAGFEIRDCFSWLFGQGFPKSLNCGAGRGTALKPAWEPIIVARKPFKGSVAANLSTHGTGALNIDACRIAGLKPDVRPIAKATDPRIFKTGNGTHNGEMTDEGRWPANVVLDEGAAALLDAQSGELVSGGTPEFRASDKFRNAYGAFRGGETESGIGASAGGASRFYYVAKPSREERDYGCGALPEQVADAYAEHRGRRKDEPARIDGKPLARGRNIHPTVKPVELMRWLVRLVTPLNGRVLDPFTGSGTTGMACRYELLEFVGIEREEEYAQIAERRIAAVAPLFNEASA